MKITTNNTKICNFCLNKHFDKEVGTKCKLKFEINNISDSCSGYDKDKNEFNKYIYGSGAYKKTNDRENIYSFPYTANRLEKKTERLVLKKVILKSKWFYFFLLINFYFFIQLFFTTNSKNNNQFIVGFIVFDFLLLLIFFKTYFFSNPFLTIDNKGISVKDNFISWNKIGRIYVLEKRKSKYDIYNMNMRFFEIFLVIEQYGKTITIDCSQMNKKIKELNSMIDNFRNNSA